MSLKQSYKIYINEVQLLLISSTDQHLFTAAEDTLVVAYMGKVKMLINYIDMCEKKPKFHHLVIHYNDYNELKKDFIGEINEAGGGFIQNDFGEFFSYSDAVPGTCKGKIEKVKPKAGSCERSYRRNRTQKGWPASKTLCCRNTHFRTDWVNASSKKIWYLMHSQSKSSNPKSQKTSKRQCGWRWMNWARMPSSLWQHHRCAGCLEKEYSPLNVYLAFGFKRLGFSLSKWKLSIKIPQNMKTHFILWLMLEVDLSASAQDQLTGVDSTGCRVISLQLFAETSGGAFEKALNDRSNHVNNLDLNEDGTLITSAVEDRSKRIPRACSPGGCWWQRAQVFFIRILKKSKQWEAMLPNHREMKTFMEKESSLNPRKTILEKWKTRTFL